VKYQIVETNRLGNRTSNQDRFASFETEEGVLLVLADGMGGQAGGEIAAELLIAVAQQMYLSAARPVVDPKRLFHDIISESHSAILRYGQAQTPPVTPGTTAVLCLVENARAIWAHAGDSRLYIFKGGLPIYRTIDHSYVEHLYQKGTITRFEQETHPMRNRITQCIGAQQHRPELTYSHLVKLDNQDVILLCSDGLWGGLDDAQMGSILEGRDLEGAINEMATKAESNNYPSSDNISVLALKMLDTKGETKPITLGNSEKTQRFTESLYPEEIQEAIDDLEAVLREYEDELKD
jgi:serine/threonine protein phosphatase PrpC